MPTQYFSSPPLDGLDALVREVAELRREIEVLKKESGRYVKFGNDYLLRLVGSGGTASMELVRTADGFVTVIAP